jgi:hypothetical protein
LPGSDEVRHAPAAPNVEGVLPGAQALEKDRGYHMVYAHYTELFQPVDRTNFLLILILLAED